MTETMATPKYRINLAELGEASLTQYQSNSERLQAIESRMKNRQEFCTARGINLDLAIQQATTSVATKPATAAPSPSGIVPVASSPAETFEQVEVTVRQVARDNKQNGFTFPELLSVVATKGIDVTSKERRTPYYKAVQDLMQVKFLCITDAKRGDDTIYYLA